MIALALLADGDRDIVPAFTPPCWLTSSLMAGVVRRRAIIGLLPGCLALAVAFFAPASLPISASDANAVLPAVGRIQIHPKNPRYFLWNGRPTVLVASSEHYGSVVNPDFDFVRYLATLQAAGLNHTRIFLGDYVEGPQSFGIAHNTLAPSEGRLLAPWARSSIPGFACGGNKFDLDQWDPAYFQRLHAFFEEAAERGVVVEAVLFFVGPGWAYSPLNPRNNISNRSRILGELVLRNRGAWVMKEACRDCLRRRKFAS